MERLDTPWRRFASGRVIALVAWALLLSTASAAGAGELEEAHRLVSNGDCEGAPQRIEALLAGHPDPSQAADAELLRGFCWRVRGDEDAYLESLRRIPDRYPGTEGSARALVSLGLHYARNKERDEARRCFERALTEVDPNSKWAQVARSELEHLDWYLFSPLYDRLMNRIDRWVLAPYFPDSLSWVRTALDLALTRLVVKLVALAFCLAPLWISQRSVPPRPRESMLRGPWSAGLLTGVLVALWSLDAAREVVWAALSYKGDVIFFE